MIRYSIIHCNFIVDFHFIKNLLLSMLTFRYYNCHYGSVNFSSVIFSNNKPSLEIVVCFNINDFKIISYKKHTYRNGN